MAEHLRPDGSRWDHVSLAQEATDAQRLAIMRDGATPDLDSLAGSEFAGINSAWISRLIGAKKFMKGFYRGPARAEGPDPFIQGYNINVRQNGVGNPHHAKPSTEDPKRFGFYRVHRVVPGARHSRYPNALLLDYWLGGNPFYEPARVLRDYLVQIYPDDPDLLLGHADVALGIRFRLSFFVLQRQNSHDYAG